VVEKWKSYFWNRLWRPIGLWDVETAIFSRQLAHRWRWYIHKMKARLKAYFGFIPSQFWSPKFLIPSVLYVISFFFFVDDFVARLSLRSPIQY
jgi:hypothetical protein